MAAPDAHHPDALPRAYAGWRRRMLVAALVATVVGHASHGATAEFRVEFEGGRPSLWLVLQLLVLAAGSFGPSLVGAVLVLTAIGAWRQLGVSCRLARWGWIVWVLGPLPILLLPVSNIFGLDAGDALKTSVGQVRHLLTVTAPAFFALLPGALQSALVLKRFLPGSRASGYITLLAAPACTAAYLLPLGVLAQVAFHTGLYFGLLLLACSPLIPLLAVGRLLRRITPGQSARLVRNIGWGQGLLAAVGALMLAGWAGEHPLLRAWLGQVDSIWVLGVVAKVLASKWLTTIVVTDLSVAMLHHERDAARAFAGTADEEALVRRLEILGGAMQSTSVASKRKA